MQLSRLHLHQFRSHTDREFQFDSRLTAMIGPNGSGKTNILEAIYTLCNGKSFRGGDDELISYTQDWYRIEGEIDGVPRELRYQPSNKGKQLLVDGTVKGRFTYRQQLPVVLFEPDDLLMIHASPSARRKYIDELLQKTHPAYRQIFSRYERVVAQRNNLLKQHYAPSPALTDNIFVWDVSLSELGASIVAGRIQLLEEINSIISETYSEVAGKEQVVLLSYQSDTENSHEASSLTTALSRNLAHDVRRGFTTVGPHRDDIEFSLNIQSAKHSASRGEVRSIVLSLKLIEILLIHKSTDVLPLLLLDDVFSELDETRQESVLQNGRVQTILTTTGLLPAHASQAHVINLG